MENNNSFIIEDIYEPINFQMKNKKGEIFDCQTQFRTTEENIKIEKLINPVIPRYDKNEKLLNEAELNETKSERTTKAMVIFAGKDVKFWRQFSDNAIALTIETINKHEAGKYKKKQGAK